MTCTDYIQHIQQLQRIQRIQRYNGQIVVSLLYVRQKHIQRRIHLFYRAIVAIVVAVVAVVSIVTGGQK